MYSVGLQIGIGPDWNVGASGAYYHNAGLALPSYDAWVVTVGLNHTIGSWASIEAGAQPPPLQDLQQAFSQFATAVAAACQEEVADRTVLKNRCD